MPAFRDMPPSEVTSPQRRILAQDAQSDRYLGWSRLVADAQIGPQMVLWEAPQSGRLDDEEKRPDLLEDVRDLAASRGRTGPSAE